LYLSSSTTKTEVCVYNSSNNANTFHYIAIGF
jgi:hypothetical protein